MEPSAEQPHGPTLPVTFDCTPEANGSGSSTDNGQYNTCDDHVNEILRTQTPRLPTRPASQEERLRRVSHPDVFIDQDVCARLIGTYLANIHPIWPILYVNLHGHVHSGLHVA